LLSAARRLFMERGIAGTAVSDIVREPGVAQGTFYLYFSSKDDVVDAVVEQIADEMVISMTAIAQTSALPAVDKLRRMGWQLFRDLLAERDVLDHIHRAEHEQVHDRIVRTSLRRLSPVVAGVIRQGVEEGDFHVTSPEAAAPLALAATMGMDDAGTFWRGSDTADQAGALLEFVLGGLGYTRPLSPATDHAASDSIRPA
jgi:AcrR family transcriptional regulator